MQDTTYLLKESDELYHTILLITRWMLILIQSISNNEYTNHRLSYISTKIIKPTYNIGGEIIITLLTNPKLNY